jgi:transglutaminase-like putative cysteine protease
MLLELTFRFFRRIATPTFFVFFLLVGVVGSLAYGLSDIIRGLTFPPLFNLAFISLLLGWWLARTRVKVWLAAVFILIVGFVGTYIWVGNLILPLVNFARLLVRWIWGYLQEQQDIIENLTPLRLASAELSIAINTIWVGLQDWGRSQLTDNPIFHITTTLLVWGLAIWIVSAWAGWVQQRYANTVLSLMPASVLLVTAMGFTWANHSTLLPLLFCVLLLLALTWLNANENRWQKTGIDYPVDARVDTLLAAISISVFLVAVAYTLPKISIRKMVETIRELTNPQVQQAQPFIESLGIDVSKPSIGRFGPLLTAGLPRAHLIGAGPELSEQVVMTVQITGGLPPGKEANNAIPLYWRGLTYDRYAGSGWNSSDVSLRKYRPDESVGVFERPGYWIVEQEVRFTDERELLFAAGDLITADERFRVAWRSEPWLSDIEQFPGDFFGAVTDEPSYRANAFIPVVDENTLRESSFLYPDWILENYILVPISTPQRVIQHSLSLTEGVQNPYDRAKIIEGYLRQFEYTTDLPAPPEDRDIVDYFLFDLRKGYCDYFATAMVVMARAAHLPARLVVGYSRGTYDPVNDRYMITEADAHSWPEIYFAGIGWVPFEPTSALKEITRSEQPLEFPGDSAFIIEPDSMLGGLKPLFGSWMLTFGIAALVLVWVWMIWITLDEWLLKRHSPEGMATRLYWRLYNYGRWFGVPASKEVTPHQFSEALQMKVTSLPVKSLAIRTMYQVSQAVERLTHIYVQAQYSSEALDEKDKDQILVIWQRLRRQLVLARSLFWVRKLIRTKPPDPESENLE